MNFLKYNQLVEIRFRINIDDDEKVNKQINNTVNNLKNNFIDYYCKKEKKILNQLLK